MILKEFDELIKQWIDNNKETVLSEWMELIKIPSIISEAKENAPYGEECAKALLAAGDLFEKYGFKTDINTKDGYALSTYGDGDKTIGLFAHSDVVPVGEGWMFTEPFEPVVKENTLIGRGSEDNKSGIMQSLCIMRMIKELNLPVKSRIMTFVGSNEESGMADIEAYAKNNKQPDLSFIPDADFPCSIGEKSIYRTYATADKEFIQIVDFCGGEAFNTVLDKITVKIKYNKELESELKRTDADICVTSDGEYIKLVANGIAKHAAMPEGGLNAGYVAAKALLECKSLCDNDREILLKAETLLKSGFGDGINVNHTDKVFGRLTMVNGMIDMQDKKLRLSFDIRYGTELSVSEAEERVHKGIEALGWSAEDVENMPGFLFNPDSAVPDTLEAIYNEMTGFNKEKFTMAGGTYARFLNNAISVGTFTDYKDRESEPLKMPEGRGGAHERDEKIDLDEFFFAMRILMQYVLQSDSEINK